MGLFIFLSLLPLISFSSNLFFSLSTSIFLYFALFCILGRVCVCYVFSFRSFLLFLFFTTFIQNLLLLCCLLCANMFLFFSDQSLFSRLFYVTFHNRIHLFAFFRILIFFYVLVSMLFFSIIRGSLNKFPEFFRIGTFIDSKHLKL